MENRGEYVVDASGMVFDQYGLVYMAFNFIGKSDGAFESDDNTFETYAPKLVVAAYNANTAAMQFYKHQSTFFGEAGGVTYVDYGSTTANFYVGAATETCYAQT